MIKKYSFSQKYKIVEILKPVSDLIIASKVICRYTCFWNMFYIVEIRKLLLCWRWKFI